MGLSTHGCLNEKVLTAPCIGLLLKLRGMTVARRLYLELGSLFVAQDGECSVRADKLAVPGVSVDRGRSLGGLASMVCDTFGSRKGKGIKDWGFVFWDVWYE